MTARHFVVLALLGLTAASARLTAADKAAAVPASPTAAVAAGATVGVASPVSVTPGPQVARAWLHGRVLKLGSPDPIAGATVGVVGLSATTLSDADGSYRLAVPAGPLKVLAAAEGYVPRTFRLRRGAAEGQDLGVDFSLDDHAYTAEALRQANGWKTYSVRLQKAGLSDPTRWVAAHSDAAGATVTARLHGRVLKLGTPDPIPGATVLLMGLSITVSSDAQGYYRLDYPGGPVQVKATADGFAARIYRLKLGPKLGEDAKLNLSLDANVFTADEIRVVGHRDRPQVITTTLTQDEIKRIPGTGGDALRAVQDLPGVTIPSDFSGQLLIEGGGPNDNLYLLDNLPWPFPFHLGGIVSTVSSDLLESVDLNSAGFGARWGNVLGAVLDGRSRAGQADRLHVDADVSLIMSQLTLEGPLGLGDATFTLSGRRSYLDLVLKHLNNSNFTALPVFWDLGGTLDWHWGPDNHFRLLSLSNDDSLGIEVNGTDVPPALVGEFKLQNGAVTNGLVWTNTSIRHLRSDFSPYAYQVNVDDDLGTGFEIDDHRKIYGFKEEATYEASPTQELGFGGGAEIVDETNNEYVYNINFSSNPNALSPVAASTTVSAQSMNRYAYVQDRLQLADPLAVTVGLRYDKNDKVADDALNPRVAVELKTPGGLLWKAAWGLYSQFPTNIQLDPNFGNTGLVSERAEHTMLGVEKDLGQGRLLRVDGYFKAYNDLVVNLQPTSTTTSTTNGEQGQAEGVEFLLRQNIGTRFFGWIAYTLAKSQRLDPGYDWSLYEYDQTNVLTVVASYLMTPAWGLGVKLHYNTGPLYQAYRVQPGPPAVGVFAHDYSQRLDDYLRLDLRTDYTWRFPQWHLTAYLEILNALNRPNPEGLSYNPNNPYQAPTTIDNLPLFPYMGLEAAY
ncbi:MAG TPA: TonB-dependent receptor [bacterium]|nr:TonB-dependent receptor [bacterium]